MAASVGWQAHHAHHGVAHEIGFPEGGRLAQALHALEHAGGCIRHGHAQLRGGAAVKNSGHPRAEFADLPLEERDVSAGRQRAHGEAQAAGHVERLCADGTGGAQQGDRFFHAVFHLLCEDAAARNTRKRQSGTVLQ